MYFFLTDVCIGIIKKSGVRKFCSSSKFPDKSSAGLTRFDCSYKTAQISDHIRHLFIQSECLLIGWVSYISLVNGK